MANKSILVASPSKMLDISSFRTSTYNIHAKVTPTRMPEITSDSKQRMRASVGGRTSNDPHLLVPGCICVFCEHQFVQEIRNAHQVVRRAWDFCNDANHSDYCKKCLQSGYVMRSIDVAGQDLGVIRDMLMDLINTRNLAKCVGSTID